MQIKRNVSVPIITYHSIDESGSVISTAPQVFRRQMKHLNENGYTIVSLKRLVEMLSAGDAPLSKTAALTFDDGYHNFYSEAYPVLADYEFNATVFLVTDFCGKYNDWNGNPDKLPRSKLLAWREVRELDACGVEFGVHTKTHPDLTKIFEEEVECEILESKAAIEDALGREAETFAYPYGKFDVPVKQTVEKHFAAACSTNLGKVKKGSDFFILERIDSYYLSSPQIFKALSSRTFDRYLTVRQAMRTLKSIISQQR